MVSPLQVFPVLDKPAKQLLDLGWICGLDAAFDPNELTRADLNPGNRTAISHRLVEPG